MKRVKRVLLAAGVVSVALMFFTSSSHPQSQSPPAPTQTPGQTPVTTALTPEQKAAEEIDKKAKELANEGIPVTSQLVIDRCGTCHKKDEKNRLTRISYERTTPEGWQQVIKRMVRLNGLTITPDDARQVVKYLSNNHGLAPEEAAPAFYEAEHRSSDERIPDESLRATCVICHSLGRVVSQRRTREEWELLVTMHEALFPVVVFQGFRRFPSPPGAPPDPDPRHPVDKSLDFLAKEYPLTTPEWGSWRAKMEPPKLAGKWLVTGSELGHGRVYGEMTVEPTGVADEFTTRITLRYPKDGAVMSRTGRSIVYAGYSWRGRSTAGDGKGPRDEREAMMVSRDWSEMLGRWYWGDYEEFGIDVTLRRVEANTVITGLDHPSLKTGSGSQQVTIYGANLPGDAKADEIDFGPGVTIKRIVSAGGNAMTVEADVASNAANGMRDVRVRTAFLTGALAIYDKIDYIKVTPGAGMARLGGIKFPKQFQQFEAIAYNRGPDGKAQTADDISLGPIDPEWSIDEFPTSFEDDDKNFVGTLDQKGMFTPNVEGPNPKRRKGVDNYGDVWVVATYRPAYAGKEELPLTARSYLVVTVPLYVKWDQPEVSQ